MNELVHGIECLIVHVVRMLPSRYCDTLSWILKKNSWK